MTTSALAFRFACADISTTNGSANCPIGTATLIGHHAAGCSAPVKRFMNQIVSSGMLAYQIRKYCENAMYAQKTQNANSSLPKSCRRSRENQPMQWPAPQRHGHQRQQRKACYD